MDLFFYFLCGKLYTTNSKICAIWKLTCNAIHFNPQLLFRIAWIDSSKSWGGMTTAWGKIGFIRAEKNERRSYWNVQNCDRAGQIKCDENVSPGQGVQINGSSPRIWSKEFRTGSRKTFFARRMMNPMECFTATGWIFLSWDVYILKCNGHVWYWESVGRRYWNRLPVIITLI